MPEVDSALKDLEGSLGNLLNVIEKSKVGLNKRCKIAKDGLQFPGCFSLIIGGSFIFGLLIASQRV